MELQKAFSSSEIREIRRIIIRRWICLFSLLCMRDCPERCWKRRLRASCLMSDTITQEVALTELVESKSLKDSTESWAQADLALLERQKERFDRMPEIRKAGFDAKEQAKELEAFYRTGKGDGLWNR